MAVAQLAAEKAAMREAKEAEKAARELAAQEAREAREAEKAAREARRLEEQREREQRDALRRQQQQALAAARATEVAQRAQKRKAESDAKAARAEIKRARIRQEECDETLRQIHLVRDELETVGDRAQELLAKLLSLAGCGADPVDLQWMQALVNEASAAQERLVKLIESSTLDWRTEQQPAPLTTKKTTKKTTRKAAAKKRARTKRACAWASSASSKWWRTRTSSKKTMPRLDQEEYRRAMAGLQGADAASTSGHGIRCSCG